MFLHSVPFPQLMPKTSSEVPGGPGGCAPPHPAGSDRPGGKACCPCHSARGGGVGMPGDGRTDKYLRWTPPWRTWVRAPALVPGAPVTETGSQQNCGSPDGVPKAGAAGLSLRTAGKAASEVALSPLALQQQLRSRTTSSSAGARVRHNSGSWDRHLPTPTSPRPAWIYRPRAGMPQPPVHPDACQTVATVQRDVPAAWGPGRRADRAGAELGREGPQASAQGST